MFYTMPRSLENTVFVFKKIDFLVQRIQYVKKHAWGVGIVIISFNITIAI